MTEKITCHQHGAQEETFVCQHLANSLVTKVAVGYNYPRESANEAHPNAWCHECEKKRQAEGGESGDWSENANDYLGVKILCARCYDLMKELNS